MIVNFYVNNSSDKVLNKSLTLVKDIDNVQMFDSTNILNPQLLMKYDDDILTSNYVYVSKFKRYYYITNIDILNGKQMVVNCKVDVLKTYDAKIRAQSGIVGRQSVDANYYLTDERYPVLAKRQVVTKRFPSGFSNDGVYIMMVAGD